jgi:hypothetical protein
VDIANEIEQNWRRIQENIDQIDRMQSEIAAHPFKLRRNRRKFGAIHALYINNVRLFERNEELLWGPVDP